MSALTRKSSSYLHVDDLADIARCALRRLHVHRRAAAAILSDYLRTIR
jgi:hypothetical protein